MARSKKLKLGTIGFIKLPRLAPFEVEIVCVDSTGNDENIWGAVPIKKLLDKKPIEKLNEDNPNLVLFNLTELRQYIKDYKGLVEVKEGCQTQIKQNTFFFIPTNYFLKDNLKVILEEIKNEIKEEAVEEVDWGTL